jgi:hypothetical protein
MRENSSVRVSVVPMADHRPPTLITVDAREAGKDVRRKTFSQKTAETWPELPKHRLLDQNVLEFLTIRAVIAQPTPLNSAPKQRTLPRGVAIKLGRSTGGS